MIPAPESGQKTARVHKNGQEDQGKIAFRVFNR